MAVAEFTLAGTRDEKTQQLQLPNVQTDSYLLSNFNKLFVVKFNRQEFFARNPQNVSTLSMFGERTSYKLQLVSCTLSKQIVQLVQVASCASCNLQLATCTSYKLQLARMAHVNVFDNSFTFEQSTIGKLQLTYCTVYFFFFALTYSYILHCLLFF